MELADQRQLTALLLASVAQTRRNSPRMTRKSAGLPLVYEPPKHKQTHRTCRCGVCDKCKDNERWERIFQAKFADPYYYARPVIRCESPLNAL